MYFKHFLHFFEPQTDLRAKFLLEIFVYLKSPSREKKKQWRVPSSKTIAFSFTRPTAIRSLCTSNRLRLRTKTMAISFTKNNGAFLHQAQHDPEEFFRLGRFAVRRKVDFCKIEVPIFFWKSGFRWTTNRPKRKNSSGNICVPQIALACQHKNNGVFPHQAQRDRSLCTSNRLRLRTKKTMAFSFT